MPGQHRRFLSLLQVSLSLVKPKLLYPKYLYYLNWNIACSKGCLYLKFTLTVPVDQASSYEDVFEIFSCKLYLCNYFLFQIWVNFTIFLTKVSMLRRQDYVYNWPRLDCVLQNSQMWTNLFAVNPSLRSLNLPCTRGSSPCTETTGTSLSLCTLSRPQSGSEASTTWLPGN